MRAPAQLEPLLAGAGRAISLRRDRSGALAIAGLLAAGLVGVALAVEVSLGIAVLIALCYAPLVLVNLPLGVALWVPLAFLQGIPAFNLGGEAAGALILVAWLGSLRALRHQVLAMVDAHRGLVVALVALVVWLTLSLLWADDGAAATTDARRWWALALLFVVVATTITTERSLRWAGLAFVAGATLSAVLGMLDGSLTRDIEGGARIEGGTGDPNFLASSIVAAIALAAALFGASRSAVARAGLLVAVVVLVAGLVGSASRGGMLAAGVAVLAAFVLFRGRRTHVLAMAAVLTGVTALALTNSPAVLERVTDFDNDNGRSDLWYVAWEMGKDSPVNGVGLANFREHAAEYVQAPGGVESVGNIVESPHFVHNTYLQLFAEGGVPALGLFLVLVIGCLLAGKRAADRFERRGDHSLALLARGVLVATISILAAGLFLSSALDMRMWLLLALGPGMLAAAERRAERPAEAGLRAPRA